MFVWRPGVILAEIDRLTPKLAHGLRELKAMWRDSGDLEQAMAKIYPSLEKISIDFAVMENADARVVMLESDFDWDDVGEWPAIARHYPKDENRNVFKGWAWRLIPLQQPDLLGGWSLCDFLGVKDLIVVQCLEMRR